MWNKIKKCLGYVWASPVTLLGLSYALTFELMGWYRWHGTIEDALIWSTDESEMPKWLVKLWSSWAGHAIGNVVIAGETYTSDPNVLIHEMTHVRQYMMLGIFHPILYSLSYIAIKFGCVDAHPYFDNPFEIDARRQSGQTIDVVDALRKLKAVKEKK